MAKKRERKKFVSKDGKHRIETALPVEQVALKSQGYREEETRPASTPAGGGKSNK